MSAASIVLTDLAWSTPDGTNLLSNLDIAFGRERVGLVGRNGVGKSTLVRLIAGELSPSAGTVAVAGRLGVLHQVVAVDAEATIAELFGVAEAVRVLERAAAGEATEHDLAVADWTLEARLDAALAAMDLRAAPATQLAALSGGQRTRAALAALVFARPDFLILDEPTNNLDREGRAAVIRLLRGWDGGALVVSHDRELLEGMDAIVELTPSGAARFGGGWSAFAERKRIELAAAQHDLADAEKKVATLVQAAQTRAERQARRDAGGRRKAAKGDMPKILIGARKERAEGTSGDHARLAERRMDDAQSAAAATRERLEVLAPITVSAPSTRLPAGRVVLRLADVSAGYSSEQPVLSGLSLIVTGPERIAITGPNGAGKSTLLRVIAGLLDPFSGEVQLGAPSVLLDQDVSLLDRSQSILENFRRLNPDEGENACRAALARFRFRAGAALQPVASLSGGERIRAGLACVLGGGRPPALLILDEPTNHLDLKSIEAVEAGLTGYDGALVVVSHDEVFLQNIGVTRRVELRASRVRAQ